MGSSVPDAATLKTWSRTLAQTVTETLQTALPQVLPAALNSALTPLHEEIAALRKSVEALQHLTTTSVPGPRDEAPVHRDAPEEDPASQVCKVPDCPAPVLAKELCETHYRIMRRALSNNEDFDLSAQRPARVRGAARTCGRDNCDEPHYATDLCRRHYMAARSRIRNASRQPKPAAHVDRPEVAAPSPTATTAHASSAQATNDFESEETLVAEPPQATGAAPGDVAGIVRKQESLRRELGASSNPFEGTSEGTIVDDGSLPTAEMVSRVVAQYRGGLDRVAEVLGRNKRTLIDLLDHLDLMPYVARVRGAERQRVENASLRERLNDLLFREKLLEDLGCLKEIDERSGFEVKMRASEVAKKKETVEEVLTALAQEFRLEEAGMKRLIWRYDLRRYLRGLNLKSTTPARVRV